MSCISLGQDQRDLSFLGDLQRNVTEERPPDQPFFGSAHDDIILVLDFGQDGFDGIRRFLDEDFVPFGSDFILYLQEVGQVAGLHLFDIITVGGMKEDDRRAAIRTQR